MNIVATSGRAASRTLAHRNWKGELMMKLALTAALALAFLAAMSVSVAAGRDQHWAIERTQQAAETLRQAQSADALKRRMLMTAHMDMLGEVLQELSAMKPDPDWNMQQTALWVAEHQRIAKDILWQLMEEHRLMMKDLSGR